jgi:hypothetical protein
MVDTMVSVSTSSPFRSTPRCPHPTFPPLAEHDLFGTDGGEELAHTQGQSFLHQGVVDAIGLSSLPDQSRRFEDTEVPRDGRGADGEVGDDLAGRQLTIPEILEDLPSGGVGQGSEDASIIFHIRILATVLITNQPLPSMPK